MKHNRTCKRVVWILVFCLAGFLIYHSTGIDYAIAAETKVTLSKKEKQRLVEQGVAAYEKGQRAEAKALLEHANAAFAENYAVPYYLGAIYLEEGKLDAAISQWQRYVAMDAKSENALVIRKYLTHLRMDLAQKNASAGVAQGDGKKDGGVPDNTIAVTPFKNVGYEVLGPIGKGLAALLIADLSHVPDLEVVDRLRVQMVLNAAKVGTSGPIDTNGAAKVSALLKARHVITGHMQDLKTEKLQILSTIFDALQNTRGKALGMEGELPRFYRMEKDLACNIVKSIGKDCNKMPDGFNKIHTRSLSAFVAYAWGLDYLDRREYDQAREMFLKALEEDPEFALAEKAVVTTPTSAMRAQSTRQMIASVANIGIPSDAAGNAQIGGSGISKTKMMLGGLALVGGGAALAGGGGSGGSGSEPGPTPDDVRSLTGIWYGEMNNGAATFRMDLDETDAAVTGSMAVNGWECVTNANVLGAIEGGNFSLRVSDSLKVLELRGARPVNNRVSGTWTIDNAVAPCTNGPGDFSGAKAAIGEIRW
jgi:tetratricopeptide (TPR) repeat protein